MAGTWIAAGKTRSRTEPAHPSPTSTPKNKDLANSTPGLTLSSPNVVINQVTPICDLLPASFSQRPHPLSLLLKTKAKPNSKGLSKGCRSTFSPFFGAPIGFNFQPCFPSSSCPVGRGSQLAKAAALWLTAELLIFKDRHASTPQGCLILTLSFPTITRELVHQSRTCL